MQTFKKLRALLEKSQVRAAAVLLCLMLVGMVLETLGVGLVIPVLAIITQPTASLHYPMLVRVISLFGLPSPGRMIVVVMGGLVATYAVKEIFLGYLTLRQARFVYSIEAGLSRRLYAGYLRQPFTFHLQHNSALLIRNATTGVGQFAGAIMAATMLLSQLFVLVGVVALLLYAEPVGAIFVGGALGLAGYSFHHFTKERIQRWGGARQYHEGQRIKCLQQGLGGVRDVKILGREAEFVRMYDVHNRANERVALCQSVVTALPALWLELMAVVGLTVLVLTMLFQGKPIGAVVPTLGLFAAAAFRLMPSVNKFLTGVQNLRYNLPVIDTLYSEKHLFDVLPLPSPQARMPVAFERELRLSEVAYVYPGAQTEVLTDVNVSIQYGSSAGFIGSSGAGKSTLINIILGLLSPTSGQVLSDGVDIQPRLRAWQEKIGYVPQSVFLVDDTLRSNVAFGLPEDQIDDLAVRHAIEAAQLTKFVASLPDGLDTVVGERGVRLSGGQCQRIGIARALYRDPPVLVLDEASSALDTETEEAVMAAVNALRSEKTVLIIAHRLSTVSQCDVLYEVVNGRVRKLDAEDRIKLTQFDKTLARKDDRAE